jgi:glycosyltransferase involved in cell wall biosynthesis
MNKPNLVISCPIDTYSGYGARARDLAKALINLDKYNVKILSQRWGQTPEFFLEDNEEWTYLQNYIIHNLNDKPDIWVQHTIPNEFQAVGKYNIGVTAGIETTACKPEWIQGLNNMDLILGSSNHTINVFKAMAFEQFDKRNNQKVGELKANIPMEVLFEGVDTNLYKPKNSNFKLDKVKEDFCFLFLGHWMQGEVGEDRKNVGLLIKAFFELFKDKKKQPALILKTSSGASSIQDRNEILRKIHLIRKTINSNKLPNIYLVHGDLTNEEISNLYNHKKVKVMVNLTKGEGFGRPLLEFSMCKKPIITTGWSGHIDFLDPNLSVLLPGELTEVHRSAVNDWIIPESKWYSVNIQSFANAMYAVYNEYEVYNRRGKSQGTKNIKEFSFKAMQEKLDIILNNYIPEFPKQVELNLPKLNLPKLQKITND